MRKVLSCALGAALLFGSAAAFAGCAGTRPARAKYVIDGEYFPAERKLAAEMEVTVPNASETAFETLSFELWPNAYREGAKYSPVSQLYAPSAYYKGKSYGGIEIGSVEGAAEYAVTGEDENILSVTLSEPLFPGEAVTLGIGFEVTLAEIDHRLGAGEHNVNLANFYPVLCARGQNGWLEYVYGPNGDPFVEECADFEVRLTFPEEYKAAHTGEGAATVEGGKKTLSVSAENVRNVAFVLGKDLTLASGTAGDVAVEYWYLDDKTPERTLKCATDSLACFSRTFGEYDGSKYVVVETDFPYGGMEYAGLSMISSDLQPGDVAEVVAHETAHQWWCEAVGSNQFEHPWQDEALAEYSAALFFGSFPEYGEGYAERIRRSESGYRAFFSVRSQVTGEADTSMDRPLTAYSGEYEYRNIAYDKGVILLDRVRSVLGDGKFFSGLETYYEKYAGKIASPEDLIACFRGTKIEDLFRSFTEGKCVI